MLLIICLMRISPNHILNMYPAAGILKNVNIEYEMVRDYIYENAMRIRIGSILALIKTTLFHAISCCTSAEVGGQGDGILSSVG